MRLGSQARQNPIVYGKAGSMATCGAVVVRSFWVSQSRGAASKRKRCGTRTMLGAALLAFGKPIKASVVNVRSCTSWVM